MTSARAVLLAALPAALLAAGCTGGKEPPVATDAPQVILITLDTFRADHMGCAGSPTVRTPRLDQLARRGTQWSGAVTPIPLTTPSHASILSGAHPRDHGLVANRMRLRPSVATIPSVLGARGLNSAAVVSSPIVLGRELGLDRGFAKYRIIPEQYRLAPGQGVWTTNAALELLSGNPDFLWVHYFDAHLPYTPPAPMGLLYGVPGPYGSGEDLHEAQTRFREGPEPAREEVQAMTARYAAEVTFLDACVGTVVRAAPGATILLTADHGEGLFDHDRYFGHDIHLYEPSLRVPLLAAGAGVDAGRLVQTGVATTDVAPTILAMFGMDAPSGMTGRDLLRDPPGEGDAPPLFAETHPLPEKGRPLYALRTEKHKVVWEPRAGRWRYYDLVADPAEQTDLSEERSQYLEMLESDLRRDLTSRPPLGARPIRAESAEEEANVRDALRSLGYVN
ncbi:MAG: sulfatase-like hydrolase/transferase [Gemmatimonadota bacterium]|jgi:arylsulfatase A-like enzyme|nr:sulfatase-like hydrolase/transferase [Gemmatimonadota bacterium]MDP6528177.1 sulfatase-like hydrolase/transferase [Gemmatimonadota bacterium]MDP6801787.1 sulfatase-like hydrolase/transferase [Gemmatimonadota bacterium]MDP7031137.1 sulfatase-like hydrolase/transferase [Gemmatimonadota bacterium]